MRHLLILLAGLSVVGCKDMPQARTEAQIRDIASDAATDATAGEFSNVSDRLDDLETKVNDLEAQNGDLEGELADEQQKAHDLEAEVESLRAKVGY